jgi:hypothetical protein
VKWNALAQLHRAWMIRVAAVLHICCR